MKARRRNTWLGSALTYAWDNPIPATLVACVAWRVVTVLFNQDEEEPPDRPHNGEHGKRKCAYTVASCSERERQPSFTITNERGEHRGELNEHWRWQVEEAPLAAAPKPVPALRRPGEVREARKVVKFKLDQTCDSFYGFVFTYEGQCVAHGANSFFVGLSLPEVLKSTENTSVDGSALHKRFVAAAEAGGGWVSCMRLGLDPM